ncbi:MAG: glycosyltransferase [Actinomycetes bacterium]
MPRLSVIIPAYNAEAYLRETVDSALAQTHPDLEVIVVDDGSTDGTRAILDAYGDRIVAVTQPNGGPAAARNHGLRLATGEYIGLLDADDLWAPTRAERCLALLEADPGLTGVLTDSWRFADDPAAATECIYRDRRGGVFPARDEQLAASARGNFLTASVFVRREVVFALGGFDPAIFGAEDYDLWCRILLAGGAFALIEEPLSWYRVVEGSVSSNRSRQWRVHLQVFDKHLEAWLARGCRPARLEAASLGRVREARGDRAGAARAYRAAAADAHGGERLRLLGLAARARVVPRRGEPQ